MLRRDFLKGLGVFFVAATVPGVLSACGRDDKQSVDIQYFPQGIASGDPRPESVVIWVRALPMLAGQTHAVTAEVSLDEAFSSLVMRETFVVSEASDYTLKVVVQNLAPDQRYYYRFMTASGQFSAVGRTWTAPSAEDKTDLHFAFVACQNRRHGFYSAYRQMINDDLKASPERQIRFILHLGDFIYETNNDPLMKPLDDALNPLETGLFDQSGKLRTVGPFPEGGTTSGSLHYAKTLADYRHLYREYLRDPDLQAARARWPFICIWDDHEFSDDSWQSEANYNNQGSQASTDEPSQPRKVAANQAWFEYIPVNLAQLDDVPSDLRHTQDFEFASVQETENLAVDESNFAINTDNVNAINTMTIYRSFRFGALMSLLVTDNRSYRSDHAVPEAISGNESLFAHPRMLMPLDLLNQLDAGRTDQNGNPDAFIFADGFRVNPRLNAPVGTMLGSRQKKWWKDTMQATNTPWKFWANPVPLMRFLGNLSALNTDLPDVVLSADSWDGYASERNELMDFLRAQNIANVVSISGDFHAHCAGLVMDDYARQPSDAQEAVATEFVCAGISSVSMFDAVSQISERENPSENEQLLQRLIHYEVTDGNSGQKVVVNNLNNTLLNGALSGLAAAETHSLAEIIAAKNDAVNKHLKYVDTDAQGYALVGLTENLLNVSLITIRGINQDTAGLSPGIKRTARFSVPSSADAGGVDVSDPQIEGTPPFPL